MSEPVRTLKEKRPEFQTRYEKELIERNRIYIYIYIYIVRIKKSPFSQLRKGKARLTLLH
jgi:hypothetical protein